MNRTSYHVLSSGTAARVGGDFTVLINRNIFSSPNSGGFDTLRGVRMLDPGAKREAILVHETLHQAARAGKLSPGVTFASDSETADPNYPNQHRQNNTTVLNNCFPGE
jgi:hypothetical protein